MSGPERKGWRGIAVCALAAGALACSPNAPKEGLWPVSGGASGVAVRGSLVAVAHGEGMELLEAADPAAPARLGGAKLGAEALDVALSDGLAAVVTGKPALALLNITDPSAPIALGSVAVEGRPSSVALEGTLVVVMDVDAGLQAIDVANTAAPRARGRYEVEGNAFGIALSGGMAFLAVFESGVHVVDLSDPDKPKRAAILEKADKAWDVSVSGETLCVAHHTGGIVLLDLKQARNGAAKEIGALDLPGSSIRCAAFGTRACIATKKNGLHEIDVSDPARPRLAATRAEWDGVADLAASEGLLAAATPQGVRLLRIAR